MLWSLWLAVPHPVRGPLASPARHVPCVQVPNPQGWRRPRGGLHLQLLNEGSGVEGSGFQVLRFSCIWERVQVPASGSPLGSLWEPSGEEHSGRGKVCSSWGAGACSCRGRVCSGTGGLVVAGERHAAAVVVHWSQNWAQVWANNRG